MNERVLLATFAGFGPAVNEADVVDTLVAVWFGAIYAQAISAGGVIHGRLLPSGDRGISSAVPEAKEADCAGAGIRRVKHGRGFRYEDEAGDRLTDEGGAGARYASSQPARMEGGLDLPRSQGHIQAPASTTQVASSTSTTTRGERSRTAESIEQMLELADAAPRRLRRQASRRRLGAKGFTRDRVLAGGGAACSTSASFGSERASTRRRTSGTASPACASRHVRSKNGA